MRRLSKPNSKKISFQSILILMGSSALLLLGFQNCGSPIQVTDGVAVQTSLASSVPPADQNTEPNEPSEPASPGVPILPDLPEEPAIPVTPVNPFDPTTPGISLLPIESEWASIAFEDNILSPDGGDRDFNDAVFNYKIAELYNIQSQLTKIFIEVRLREKLSAGNHKLHLSLNGDPREFFDNIDHVSQAAFIGEANLKMIMKNGEVILKEDIQNKLVNIFSSSSGRKNEIVKLEITLLQPELNTRTPNQESVDFKKYRFMLQNHGQDRIGIDIAEINRTPEMLANSNYPFGFMIPADWQPPMEKQLIDRMYPKFQSYRNWLFQSLTEEIPMSNEAATWFILQN